MPFLYGALGAADAEEGHVQAASSTLLFHPVQLQTRRAGWRKNSGLLVLATVAGCLLLVLSNVNSGRQGAAAPLAAQPAVENVGKLSELAALETRLVHAFKTDGQKLVNIMSWGTLNPETGMSRVQCDDSVAEGRCACVYTGKESQREQERVEMEKELRTQCKLHLSGEKKKRAGKDHYIVCVALS